MNVVLSRLKEITSAVMYAAEAHDIETVLERIADVARELAQTRYAALGIPNGKGGLRFFKTVGMTPEEIAMIDHLPEGHGLIGAIMRERQTIRLEHMRDDERSTGFPTNHPHMDSFLGVPIQVGGQLFGMLYLSDKLDGEPFNEKDEVLIETLAGYAALTIASIDISQQRSRMRLLEERQRIGMELHDGIIQSLYGIGMQLDLLRGDNMMPQSDVFDGLIDNLNDVIEDIRAYIMDLRRRSEAGATIRNCIVNMVERLHLGHDFEVVIDAPEEVPPFPPAVFESICLIVNEALSNAARHSGASALRITVEMSDSHLLIDIVDNGTGFDVGNIDNQNGLGLRNMRHRARLYGGSVDIMTAPQRGTHLSIRIPIR